VFADEYNQKKIMIFADLARALSILLLIYFSDSLLLLYLAVFLIGLFTALFEPSKKSMIPFIVKRKHLIPLNKILALFEIFAIFLGILIGSVLLEFFTTSQALTINLITYLISFVLIVLINYKPKKVIKEKKESTLKDFKKGLLYLKENLNAKHVILNITMINFFAAGLNFSSISDYTIRNPTNLDPGSQIGVFLLTMAIGAMLTPIFNKLIEKRNFKDSVIISNIFLIGGFSTLLITTLMYLDLINYYFLLAFFFISGILVGIIYTRILYLLHLNTNEHFYGRVISINDLVSSSTTILGILIGGVLVEFLTYKVGFLLTGLTFIIGYFYFKAVDKKINW
jgi:MFS family permease